MLAGIDENSLLSAIYTVVEMKTNKDYGIPVSDYIKENVLIGIIKII